MIGLAPEIPEDLYMLIKKVRLQSTRTENFRVPVSMTNTDN